MEKNCKSEASAICSLLFVIQIIITDWIAIHKIPGELWEFFQVFQGPGRKLQNSKSFQEFQE